jgi:acyl-CoA thioesterase I
MVRGRRSGGGGWDRPPRWALAAMLTLGAALAVSAPLWLQVGADGPARAAAPSATPSATTPAAPTAVAVVRPSDRPLRVLFIGDSLMWGSFASDESLTYRELVASALRADGPVDVVTVGGPGESAAEAARHLADEEPPVDLVLVELGANDSVAVEPGEFGADYAALLDGVRALAPEAGLLCAGVWNGPEIAAGFDRELRPACAEHGGLVVPLSELYVDETLRGPEGSAVPGGGVRDQFHPNDAGHAAIADALLAALDR